MNEAERAWRQLAVMLAGWLAAACEVSSGPPPAAAGAASAPDPGWQRCQADADCVASFGPCGEWLATGRAQLKEQQAWARQAGRALSCPVNDRPAPPVGCRAQRCVLTPKAS